jgi:hypothetical protein
MTGNGNHTTKNSGQVPHIFDPRANIKPQEPQPSSAVLVVLYGFMVLYGFILYVWLYMALYGFIFFV